jgi:hypothetical protein
MKARIDVIANTQDKSITDQSTVECAKKKKRSEKQKAYNFSVYVKLPSIDGIGPDSSLKLRSLYHHMVKVSLFQHCPLFIYKGQCLF